MQNLILFDIDGTLVRNAARNGHSHWQERVTSSIKIVFGVKVVKPDPKVYNGFVDRNMAWYLVRDAGVTKSDFDRKYPKFSSIFYNKTREHYQMGLLNFQAIPEAVTLVRKLRKNKVHALGLITGNTEANAWFKLECTGIRHYFEFGAFTDTVEDRVALAHHALEKSKKHFGRSFRGKEVIIIGDTKHDVRSGKSIGAFTIAVATGFTDTAESLKLESPDLLVESLMDERVLNLLGL